jgi:hypothetical protein
MMDTEFVAVVERYLKNIIERISEGETEEKLFR